MFFVVEGVYVSPASGFQGSTEQQQRQPVHAEWLEKGAAQDEAKVDPVQVVYVSVSDDPEGPTLL